MRACLLIALAFAAAAPAAHPQGLQPGPTIDGRFDIGGRAIRMVCEGTGLPVVVIDAGMGTAPVEDAGWRGIATRVSPVARVCLVDRAGVGGSDPPKQPTRTSGDAADDLHAALEAAAVPGPYLLAGHSVGGLHAQVFAHRYPDAVAGLVLLSSTHPEQMTTWRSLLPPRAVGEDAAITDLRDFLDGMLEDPTRNPEALDVRASSAQARALGTLGAKPLVIATHSPRYRMAPGIPETLAVELEAATQAMQAGWRSLSSNATQRIAATAGHGLPHEDPDFVVDSILAAVEAVRQVPDAP